MSLGSRDLIQILAVAEKGSIRRAAASLGMTQPGLSKNIRAIEGRLQTTIFERVPSGATPTRQGTLLIERGRQILLDLQGVERDVRDLASDEGGSVRIGAGAFAALVVARDLVSDCLRLYPGLSIHLEIGSPYRLVEKVEQGTLDLLVSFAESLPLPNAIQVRRVGTVSGAFFARRGHPLAQLNAVPARRLAEWPMALPTTYPRFIEWYAAHAGAPRPIVQFLCDNYDLIGDAVEATDLVSVSATPVVDRLQRRLNIAPINVEGFDFHQDINCISSSARPPSRATRKVLALIENSLDASPRPLGAPGANRRLSP